MRFKEKYPPRCNQMCPRCKLPCMYGMEKHFNEDGCIAAHVCGPHWWIEIAGPDAIRIQVSGFMGIRRVTT